MLGYDLYGSALADILTEPSLSMPITVGLYAKWGSGKSFLLKKLQEEMQTRGSSWRTGGLGGFAAGSFGPPAPRRRLALAQRGLRFSVYFKELPESLDEHREAFDKFVSEVGIGYRKSTTKMNEKK